MMPNQTIIHEFLKKLGFSDEEIKLYIAIFQKGPVTLLEASRVSGIERTKLYRIIDSLQQKKIIEEVPQYKRRTIKACDISTIELLVKERELQDRFLINNFPTFTNALSELSKPLQGSNVIFYRGVEGIRQMTWNILRCKGLFRTYSYRFWDDILGTPFVLKLNERMVEQKFEVHDVYSDQYLIFKKEWLKAGKGKPSGNWNLWDSRYISEKILTVNQNIDVYNDVVSYYYWQGNETFGVEIYNQRVADFHKQMHDVVWNRAKQLPDIDWKAEWEKKKSTKSKDSY